MSLNGDAWKVLAWVATHKQTKVVGEKERTPRGWVFIFLDHWHFAGTPGLGDCYPLIFSLITGKSLAYPKIQRRQNYSNVTKNYSNVKPEFSVFMLIFGGKHLTGGCSFYFLPFLTLSSSVSLTVITSNGSKDFGIVSVTSQRTVKYGNGIANNCSCSDDASSVTLGSSR